MKVEILQQMASIEVLLTLKSSDTITHHSGHKAWPNEKLCEIGFRDLGRKGSYNYFVRHETGNFKNATIVSVHIMEASREAFTVGIAVS